MTTSRRPGKKFAGPEVVLSCMQLWIHVQSHVFGEVSPAEDVVTHKELAGRPFHICELHTALYGSVGFFLMTIIFEPSLQICPAGSMVRSGDIMRLLENCGRMKLSALLLDSHMCLIKKLKSMLTHCRPAPEHRINVPDLVQDLEDSDPAGEDYFLVWVH